MLPEHQAVFRATQSDLARAEPDFYGLLATRGAGTIKVRVSRELLPRALTVLQMVIDGVEARRWVVRGRKAARWPSQISNGAEAIDFFLAEQSQRVEVPKWQRHAVSTPEYAPIGRLRLGIESYSNEGNQKAWSDSRNQKVEDCIGLFLDAVADTAERKGKRNREFEEQRRRDEEARHRAAEAKQRLDEELSRRSKLVDAARGLQRVRDIRHMIKQLRARSVADPATWPVAAVDRWAAWAEAIAQRHDPFTNGYFDDALKEQDFAPELEEP